MASIPDRPQDGAAPISERRSTTRVGIMDNHLVPVEIGNPGIFGLLVDLSEAGMGVQTLDALPLGRNFSLSFALPGSKQRVEADGRVTWVDSNGRAGLRFSFIDDTSRHDLASWVQSTLQSLGSSASDNAAPPRPADPINSLAEQIKTQQLYGEAALQIVAERLLEITQANGAAVALGSGAYFICQASAGLAPELGTRMQATSGLSLECVQTGRIVRCDDAERDERVSPEVARALALRSAIVVPVKHGTSTCGLLELFSSQPYAFDGQCLVTARHAADLIAHLANPEVSAPPTPPDSPDDQWEKTYAIKGVGKSETKLSSLPAIPAADVDQWLEITAAPSEQEKKETEAEIERRRRDAVHLGSIVDPLADEPAPATDAEDEPTPYGRWLMVLAIAFLLLAGLVAGWYGYVKGRNSARKQLASVCVLAADSIQVI